MRRASLGAALTVLLSLGACAPTTPLVGLYASALCQKDTDTPKPCEEPTAVVGVASNAPTADPATAPATQFAERAEAAYIKALTDPHMSADAKALRVNLAAPLKDATVSLDRRHITRNLTVTTTKTGAFSADDRLQQTEVLIRLANGAGRITTWDSATSVFNVINAGTLQVSTVRGGEADLAVGTPATSPTVASLGQKFTYSNTNTQSANGTTQAESLTITVEDNGQTLRIFRQGGPGVDLTGNVAVKVGFALAGHDKLVLYHLDGLFDAKGDPADPKKVLASRSELDVGHQQALTADVSMRYVTRHVVRGGGSLAPGTQRVIYHDQAVTGPRVELVPLAEAYPDSFGVFPNTGNIPAAIQLPGLSPDSLCFATYDEAQALQRYLALGIYKGKVGQAALGWLSGNRFTPLAAADLQRLDVRSNCHGLPHSS